MKLLQNLDYFTGSFSDYGLENLVGSSYKRLNQSVQLMSMILVFSVKGIRKRDVLYSSKNEQELELSQTGNLVLDTYLEEGRRLFNQGKYASNIVKRNSGDEL
jgi:hypothetical protein